MSITYYIYTSYKLQLVHPEKSDSIAMRSIFQSQKAFLPIPGKTTCDFVCPNGLKYIGHSHSCL